MTLAVCMIGTPAFAQFKCTLNDGSVAFQQTPCPTAARAERLVLPPPPPDDGRDWARALIAKRKVAPGMTRAEMLRSWGTPTKCNTSNVGGVLHDQCIYEGDGGTSYIYLRNSVVESWQDSPR